VAPEPAKPQTQEARRDQCGTDDANWRIGYDGLAYLGALTTLAAGRVFTFVAPFQGKPLRLRRAVSQAMQAGVGAAPLLSLITFFIGLILALQSAYELRKFGP